MSDINKTYVTQGRVVVRRIGGDNLLVPVSGGTAHENVVFPVNDTALFVWERLLEKCSIGIIVDKMVEFFDVQSDVCLKDCLSIVKEFENNGLIKNV